MLNVGFWNGLIHLVLVTFFPVYAVAAGMGPAQIGLLRAVYFGINAVGRPIVGVLIRQMSLVQATWAGIGVQVALMALLPFIPAFEIVFVMFAICATGRSVVVVTNAAALAEDVDETRVSRGVATSAYSATFDLSSLATPLVAGAVATALGVGSMITVMAVGSALLFVGLEAGIGRWRAMIHPRLAPKPSPLVG